jgi:hypothetical protein
METRGFNDSALALDVHRLPFSLDVKGDRGPPVRHDRALIPHGHENQTILCCVAHLLIKNAGVTQTSCGICNEGGTLRALGQQRNSTCPGTLLGQFIGCG